MFDFEEIFNVLARIFVLIALFLGVVYFGFYTFFFIHDSFSEYTQVCDSSCICSCCDNE